MPKIQTTLNFSVPPMTTQPVLSNVDPFQITKNVRGESHPEGLNLISNLIKAVPFHEIEILFASYKMN